MIKRLVTDCALDGAIAQAIAQYTDKRVVELSVCADDTPGRFVARARVRLHSARTRVTDRTLFFLIRSPLQRVTTRDLEELEHYEWPD